MQALQNFDKLNILNTNLVFGRDSYLLHYMTQCAYAGKISKAVGGSKNFQYKPISSDDLTTAVEAALGSDEKGQRFQVNGTQQASLNDILHLIEQSVGKDAGSTGLRRQLLGLGISDYVEEFFTGITHDKNMGRMAQYMDAHTPNFEAGSPDFFKHFGLTQKVGLKEYFQSTKVKEEDLVFPIFSDYKMVSLN